MLYIFCFYCKNSVSMLTYINVPIEYEVDNKFVVKLDPLLLNQIYSKPNVMISIEQQDKHFLM